MSGLLTLIFQGREQGAEGVFATQPREHLVEHAALARVGLCQSRLERRQGGFAGAGHRSHRGAAHTRIAGPQQGQDLGKRAGGAHAGQRFERVSLKWQAAFR